MKLQQVWVVIGRRSTASATRYVIEVWAHKHGADAQRARWLRQHPKGEADVEPYHVLNGGSQPHSQEQNG